MTNERTIVLVTTSFPRLGDGSEAAGGFVADLAVELTRFRKVLVVAPGDKHERESWSDGLEVYRFAAPKKPMSTLRPWHPAELLALARVMLAGQKATRLAIETSQDPQVLALWALPSGAWARRATRKVGVPYSVWTLGSDVWSLGRLPIVRSWLRRVLFDAEVCYSDGIGLAQETRQIARREVEFLPSTRRIEGRRLAARIEAPYRLLFLGRWHPNKGVDLLLDALARLSDDDWTKISAVEICGGGPLERKVRSGVADLVQLGRPVIVRGYLDKSEAEAAMLRADWLLIPSRIESIPVVFSDAMKLGLPVISMPVGDLATLVGGPPACGCVAASVGVEAFSSAISLALSLDASQLAVGVAARAAQFNLGKIAERILADRPRGST